MADRKSLFSRFWPASASRRIPATQTAPPSPLSKPVSQTTPTTSNPLPTDEKGTPAKRSSTEAGSSPTTDQQPAEQLSNSTSESGKLIPSQTDMTTSPSRATTQSSSPSKTKSANGWIAQSRSPPQPSSPSRASPRMTSQTPSTPKRASQPSSPSRLNTRSPYKGPSSSPKRTQPTPSKQSRQPTQEIESNEKDPKPAASGQEPQPKAEVKSDGVNDLSDKTLDGTNLKINEVGITPSQSSGFVTSTTPAQSPEAPAPSKSLTSSTMSGEHEPLVELVTAKPEETKDVKEVVEATITEANEETEKKQVDGSLSSKSSSEAIVEKAEITSKVEQLQGEKQEALRIKNTSATSLDGLTLSNTRNSQPTKRNTISGSHDTSALPNGEHVPMHKNIRDSTTTFANQIVVGDPKGPIYDKPVSVITLAGENRGATMKMESGSSKKEGPVHIHRSYKINPDESAEATTDGEGSSDVNKSKDANSKDDQSTEAFVNNNAQGINNSIVFNSSFTEGNPGVHMIVTYLTKEQVQSIDSAHHPETRKAEFNRTHIEKLTYQPTIRRRCLRGLFLETSDSDSEKPEKPRRHGCRVGCEKRDKENSIDVL